MDELPPLPPPGQRLGRYELLERLAVGGMAELYLARAQGPSDFSKLVAVKRMLPQHALDLQLLRMFRDEARLMARLAHPNIPQVYDVGDRADVPYFVLEYVPGTDLRAVLSAARGQPMPLPHALAVAGGVAAGLHHAHELRGEAGQALGIVHRDVSPSNVLVSFDGSVKITDFGVAKWAEQRSFTEHGQLKGKLAHMSPEQCRGEPLDRRSDVYALGVLMYEMTTGRLPFVAESEYEVMSQIVSRDAPPPQRPDGYPPELAAIVARALARSPTDRHPTAQALQLDLEAFSREHRLTVSPVALAEYLESLFGPRAPAGRAALAAAAAEIAGDDGSGAGPTATDVARARTATDLHAAPASRPEPATVAVQGTHVTRRARRRRRVAIASAGALGVFALAVAVVAWTTASARRTSDRPRPAAAEMAPAPTSRPAAAAPDVPPLGAEPEAARAAVAPGAPPSTVAASVATPGSGVVTEVADTARTPRRRDRSATRLPRRQPAAAASDVVGTVAEPAPLIAPPARSPSPPPVKVWDPDSPVPP